MGTVHNYVHFMIGGHMTSGISPIDPIFFMHHNMVDKVWDDWQKQDTVLANTDYAAFSDTLDGTVHNYVMQIVELTPDTTMEIEKMCNRKMAVKQAGDSEVCIGAKFI